MERSLASFFFSFSNPLAHPQPQDTIERNPAALSTAAGAAPSGAAARKAARAEKSMKFELLSVMAGVRLKQMAVGTAATFGLFKGVLGRLPQSGPVAALPFQATVPPFSWLARRGLPADTPLDAAAATLLFALIQVGVRPLVAKLLDAGPTPRMADLHAQVSADAADYGALASGGLELVSPSRIGGGGGGSGSVRVNNKKKK
jgi:hypothetical protein